jgi:hypothetical protein
MLVAREEQIVAEKRIPRIRNREVTAALPTIKNFS